MENIDIIVEDRVFEVVVDGGRGPAGANGTSVTPVELPWVKIGESVSSSALAITKSDNVFRLGRTTLGSNQAPLALLHVGTHNNNPSTDAKVLISHNVISENAEHGFSDGSIINNGKSYNSYDARININSDIIGVNAHYAAFQNITTINAGKSVLDIYGYYDGSINNGSVTNYYGVYMRATSAENYRGVSIISGGNPSTVTAIGFEISNLTAPTAIGFSVSGINGSSISRGISVVGLLGTNRRPYYSEHNQSFSPNEMKYTQSGNADMLMFSRGSVNDGNYMGMTWEAGSGATKYYSNRLASQYNNSLQGDFLFFCNPTGNSGLGSLIEKARIKYDGSFIHEGYHQLTSGIATTGATTPNGSIFKGSDGALYYKGDSGTVTKIANT